MFRQAALFGAVIAAAAIGSPSAGCKSTQGALPTWEGEAPEDGGEVAQADVEGDEADDGAAAEAGAQPAAESGEDTTPPAAADGGETPPPGSEGGDAGEGGEKPPDTNDTPPAAVAALELPNPMHRRIRKECGKDPGVGQKLKKFKLKTPKGKNISNGSYRGRVMLVNFWGTWCKPCLKELPEFDRLYRRYRKHGLTLVAIATDEDPGPVNEYIAKRKLAARVAIGGEDYAGQYSSPRFPFSFVVDTKGVIRSSFRGFKPECMGKLEADIREQLEKRHETKAKKG